MPTRVSDSAGRPVSHVQHVLPVRGGCTCVHLLHSLNARARARRRLKPPLLTTVSTDRMIYILMGVSGCGKSALGAFLSEKLGWPLYEGDHFHPQGNIEKMARGEPLTDQDRLPWLLKLHEVIERERCSRSDALVACSALKRLYRQILLYGSKALVSSSGPNQDKLPPASPDVFFLFLHGDYDLIQQRMVDRRGHYMKADMLHSQLDVLEPPSDEENVLPLDIRRSIADMAMEVQNRTVMLKSSPVL